VILSKFRDFIRIVSKHKLKKENKIENRIESYRYQDILLVRKVKRKGFFFW
jgi:hypothetical protein